MTTGFGNCEQLRKLMDIDQDVKNSIEKCLIITQSQAWSTEGF